MADISRWPLPAPGVATSFDYRSLWTLAAGGDVNLDRAVYRRSAPGKLGPDYPWSGGASELTGHECCGTGSNLLATARGAGSPGAFRSALADADLALVNLEGPAPDAWSYHPDGYTFTFDPALLEGLSYAGIDAVGLANNHIRNAGDKGVLDTCANLDVIGVAHAGAGADLAAARAPLWLSAGGERVASALTPCAVGRVNPVREFLAQRGGVALGAVCPP